MPRKALVHLLVFPMCVDPMDVAVFVMCNSAMGRQFLLQGQSPRRAMLVCVARALSPYLLISRTIAWCNPARLFHLHITTLHYPAQCGPDVDLCGGVCGPLNGECPDGTVCQLEMRVCVPVIPCDTFVPRCSAESMPAVNSGLYYCNSLCQWQEINDQLPDVIPQPPADLITSIRYHWRTFDNCVFNVGNRLLFRFETKVINIGTASFFAGSPYQRPDLYIYAYCHQVGMPFAKAQKHWYL
jgi:hypothetical protein